MIGMHKIDEQLEKAGGLYHWSDIAAALEAGELQSFTVNDSFVVTRICEFPRKRVLDIVMFVGNIEDRDELDEAVASFGRKHGCSMMITDGRDGWTKYNDAMGWIKTSTRFRKDI